MNLSHNSPELENAFWIIADPNKPFSSSLLRPFQFCQLQLLLFLRLWSRRFAFFPHTLANLELDFFTVLVPWPIVSWNPNTFTYLLGKKYVPFRFHNLWPRHESIEWLDYLRKFLHAKTSVFDGIKFHMSKCIVIWSFSYIPKLLQVKKKKKNSHVVNTRWPKWSRRPKFTFKAILTCKIV